MSSSTSVALFRELPTPYLLLAAIVCTVVCVISLIVACAILPEAWRELRALCRVRRGTDGR